MEVKNCRGCGRLFNYISGMYFLCPACMEELDKKFAQVKEYIYQHPRATMKEIVEDNDVTPQQVERWVREDRLAFTEDSPIKIECEICGKMIQSGRFCNVCKDTMQRNLGSAYGKTEPAPVKKKDERDKNRMRFLSK